MPIYSDIVARLDQRAADTEAALIERRFAEAGAKAGTEFRSGFSASMPAQYFDTFATSLSKNMVDPIKRQFADAGKVGAQELAAGFAENIPAEHMASFVSSFAASVAPKMADAGRVSGESFGGAFGSQMARSIPGVRGFATALRGYDTAAGEAGALAGRAMGLAFTAAAGGLLGAAGFTLFEGFKRYEAIDAAKNRLENLNRTLEATGKTGIDVAGVMKTVNDVVLDTPFALDKAFSVATRALASNTGDLKRFMTDVADAAGFANTGIDNVGEAFLKVANKGKLSMREIQNELRDLPILPWLSETLGKSGAQIAEMIKGGQIGLEDLLRTIEQHANGFAKAAGNTIQGAMKNLETSVARLGANFLGAIFGQPTQQGNELVDVLKSLHSRIDDIGKWVTDHQDDIRKLFHDAGEAAKDLANAVGFVVGVIDKIPGGITTVVEAFVAWKAIEGVVALKTALTGLTTTLETELPAAAAAGATRISASLAGVLSKLGLVASAAFVAYEVGQGNPGVNNPAVTTGQGMPSYTNSIQAELDALKPGALPNGAGQYGGPGAQADRRGGHPGTAPAGTAPGGGPILDPTGAGGKKLPQAPQLAYPAEYGQPPGPGESAQHWRDRMATIDAAHTVAEKRARVDELEKDHNATQDDIIKAKNELITAELHQQESEQKLNAAKASGLQIPYDPRFGAAPRYGETATQYRDEQSLYEATHKRQVAEATLAQVNSSATHTADDLVKANNDLNTARKDEWEAQLRLHESLTKTSSKLTEIGAKLDPDFGISKGLAGIAENLVKFVADLAAAPLLGKLDAIANAPGQAQGGYGITGVLGAQGVFGPQYTAAGQASALGPPALQPGIGGVANGAVNQAGYRAAGYGGGAYPGDAALLANVPAGHYSQDPGRDLLKGLSDCSSSVGDLVNILDGQKTGSGGNLTTGDAAQWLPQHGFLPGMGGPGDFRVGYNSGHMQATLPGGTPWNWGSDAAAANRGIGGSGAFDPAFTSHYYRPVGAPTASAPSGGLYSPANTNAALTNPPAPGGSAPDGGSILDQLRAAFTGGGGEGPVFKRSPAAADRRGPAAPGYGLSWDPKYGWVGGNSPLDGIPLGSAPAPAPTSGPSGLPGVSGSAWANNQAGIPLGAPLAQGPTPGNIGPGPLQVGPPGGGGRAPGSIGPFGVPPAVAAMQPHPGTPGAAGVPGQNLAMAGVGTPGQDSTRIGGVDPLQGTGSGGIGITPGGGLDTALGVAAGAFPGLGQAAQTVAKLGSRAIQFGSQAVGILAQGAMDTWLPFGGSKLAQGGWATKILGGLAGAHPALPNIAGKGSNGGVPGQPTPEQAANVDPNAVANGQGQGPAPGPVNNITVNNQRATEDGTGRDIAYHAQNMYAGTLS